LSNSRSENFEAAQNKSWDILGMTMTAGIGLGGIIGAYKFFPKRPEEAINTIGASGIPNNGGTEAQKSAAKHAGSELGGLDGARALLGASHAQRKDSGMALDPIKGPLAGMPWSRGTFDIANTKAQRTDETVTARTLANDQYRTKVQEKLDLNLNMNPMPIKGLKIKKAEIGNILGWTMYETGPVQPGWKGWDEGVETVRQGMIGMEYEGETVINSYTGKKERRPNKMFAMPRFLDEGLTMEESVYTRQLKGATTGKEVINKFNALGQKSKARLAIFNNAQVTMPGVFMTAKGLKDVTKKQFFESKLHTFQDFWTEYGKGATRVDMNEWLMGKMANFAGRAARPTSDFTGDLNMQQAGSALNLVDSQFLGDTTLHRIMVDTGFFEGKYDVQGRGFVSISKGKTYQGEWHHGMTPMEWMFESLDYARDLEKLEEFGLYYGSINNPGLAKGFFSSARPETVLPFGPFAKETRRVDELTQLGVSASEVGMYEFEDQGYGAIKRNSYNVMQNIRKEMFIMQGMTFQTQASLADGMRGAKAAGLDRGFAVGATGTSFNLVGMDMGQVRKAMKSNPLLAQQLKAFGLDTDEAIEEAMAKGRRTYMDFHETRGRCKSS